MVHREGLPLRRCVRACSQEEVSQKRGRFGEDYWSTTERFRVPKDFEHELQRVVAAGIPINAYYMNSDLYGDASSETSFRRMSALTGGTASALDLDDASHMTNLLCRPICSAIGPFTAP